MEYLKLWLVTWIITLIWIFLVLKIFPKIWLIDKPEKYWHKRLPVPYPAGFLIPVIFFAISFFIFPITKQFIWFFLASLLLLITSFFDDLKWLSPYLRLWIQVICGGIIISSWIWISEILHPFWWNIDLNFLKIPLWVHNFYIFADLLILFWIIWMINTINWVDWVSGNVSWIWAIWGWTMFCLAKSSFVGQEDLAQLFLVFAIICSIFFIFDLENPKILMWDSGSMFIGFAIAIFSIFAWGKMATAIIIMWIPIFDAFFTVYRRIKNWDSPTKWDMKHFHHILIEKGLSRRNSVFVYIFLCSLFWIPTLFLETEWKYVLLFFLIIVIFYLEIKLRKK